MSEKVEEVEIWRTPQCDCPKCGEIIELTEESIGEEGMCDSCGAPFKAVENKHFCE